MSAGPAEREILTALQIEVAWAFFALPESTGFLLAGGAALAAQRLTVRPTEDLDLFAGPGQADVAVAAAALGRLASTRGWTVRTVRSSGEFVRLRLDAGDDSVVIDLAVDASPLRPPSMTFAGPTMAPEDLVGRKVVALFSRAEARDFADVYALAARFGTERLIELADRVDLGFDQHVLAEMLGSLDRFADDEIPVPSQVVDDVRKFAAEWAEALRGHRS